MNLRLILPAAFAMCFAASCTPYVEPPPEPPADPAARKMTPEEQEQIRKQREASKKKESEEGGEIAQKEKQRETASGGETTKPRETTGGSAEVEKPKPAARRDIPVARPVPGKPGMVFSPFNNKLIDVKGIPSGRLVADPTYPASEKMHFRVP